MNFCENAKAWLDMDEENVVSLHCKAGKGRAGIMAACLLIRLGETASDAVSKYDAVSGTDRVASTAGRCTAVDRCRRSFVPFVCCCSWAVR